LKYKVISSYKKLFERLISLGLRYLKQEENTEASNWMFNILFPDIDHQKSSFWGLSISRIHNGIDQSSHNEVMETRFFHVLHLLIDSKADEMGIDIHIVFIELGRGMFNGFFKSSRISRGTLP
jgi:hypothetical protein